MLKFRYEEYVALMERLRVGWAAITDGRYVWLSGSLCALAMVLLLFDVCALFVHSLNADTDVFTVELKHVRRVTNQRWDVKRMELERVVAKDARQQRRASMETASRPSIVRQSSALYPAPTPVPQEVYEERASMAQLFKTICDALNKRDHSVLEEAIFQLDRQIAKLKLKPGKELLVSELEAETKLLHDLLVDWRAHEKVDRWLLVDFELFLGLLVVLSIFAPPLYCMLEDARHVCGQLGTLHEEHYDALKRWNRYHMTHWDGPTFLCPLRFVTSSSYMDFGKVGGLIIALVKGAFFGYSHFAKKKKTHQMKRREDKDKRERLDKSRKKWQAANMEDTLNVSLNMLRHGLQGGAQLLQFRTLFESTLGGLTGGNLPAIKLITSAARCTTEAFPFFHTLQSQDMSKVNSLMLNQLSEKYSMGTIAMDLLDTQSGGRKSLLGDWFVFGLTCERGPKIRQTKIRLMVVREKFLDHVLEMKPPSFEQDGHKPRWQTLRAMARIWREEQRIPRNDYTHPRLLGRIQLFAPVMRD